MTKRDPALPRVGEGADLADVDVVAHEFRAVLEHGLEVKAAFAGAVVDVHLDGVAVGEDVGAEDVLLPLARAGVGGVELGHGQAGLVDDLDPAVGRGSNRRNEEPAGGEQGNDLHGWSPSSRRAAECAPRISNRRPGASRALGVGGR